jgi:hypothetical protein
VSKAPSQWAVDFAETNRRLAFEALSDELTGLHCGSAAMLNTPLYGGYAIADEHLRERAKAFVTLLLLDYSVIRRAP